MSPPLPAGLGEPRCEGIVNPIDSNSSAFQLGAEPDDDPVTAEQARQLGEMPQQEYGMGEASICHERAELHRRGQRTDGAEQRKGVERRRRSLVESAAGPSAGAGMAYEQMVCDEHAVDPG